MSNLEENIKTILDKESENSLLKVKECFEYSPKWLINTVHSMTVVQNISIEQALFMLNSDL